MRRFIFIGSLILCFLSVSQLMASAKSYAQESVEKKSTSHKKESADEGAKEDKDDGKPVAEVTAEDFRKIEEQLALDQAAEAEAKDKVEEAFKNSNITTAEKDGKLEFKPAKEDGKKETDKKPKDAKDELDAFLIENSKEGTLNPDILEALAIKLAGEDASEAKQDAVKKSIEDRFEKGGKASKKATKAVDVLINNSATAEKKAKALDDLRRGVNKSQFALDAALKATGKTTKKDLDDWFSLQEKLAAPDKKESEVAPKTELDREFDRILAANLPMNRISGNVTSINGNELSPELKAHFRNNPNGVNYYVDNATGARVFVSDDGKYLGSSAIDQGARRIDQPSQSSGQQSLVQSATSNGPPQPAQVEDDEAPATVPVSALTRSSAERTMPRFYYPEGQQSQLHSPQIPQSSQLSAGDQLIQGFADAIAPQPAQQSQSAEADLTNREFRDSLLVKKVKKPASSSSRIRRR